jgi:hypothetical protein
MNTVALDEEARSQKIERATQAISYLDNILNREISYESIIVYCVELWPQLPVSPELTRELTSEINKDRYVLVRDINREVRYAAEKVQEYFALHAERFAFSTDFVVKLLVFVDSEFREKHSMSSQTKKAAVHAGITRYK